MKKLMIAMFAFVLCTGMFSCKDKAAPAGGDADSTKVEAQAQEETPDFAALIEKAKAEGANWDEAQWKDAFKQALLCIKPMMIEMAEISEAIEKDPEKAVDLMAKLEGMGEKYADVEKNMDEWEKIVEANPIAKKISDDEEWGKAAMKELGIPEVDM